jgi:tetratricopeptide (TPR) repeat protein
VIARNSTFTYKGKAVDIKQVGRELGVRYVLEGSVRKASRKVRITGQLIEAASNNHLWADKFDGELEDIFELQDQITRTVVASIAPKLEQAEIERAKQKPTERLDSYDNYLRGMAVLHRNLDREANDFFKKAIELDPDYGAGYAMSAWILLKGHATKGVFLSAEKRAEAVHLANAAAKLAADDAFSLARSGHVLSYIGHQYDRGASLIEDALTLNPNLASAWYSRGFVALMCGEAERATESFNRLLRLSPLDPLRVNAWNGNSFALFVLGRYEEGRTYATKALQFYTDIHTLASLVLNCVGAGRAEEAKEGAAQILELQPNFTVAGAMQAFPTRSEAYRAQMAAALKEAGIPE